MPTLTGFRHAPVSKGLVIATAGASIFAQATRASRRGQLLPGILTQTFVFRSPAELFFGALVMYYFRILERESGSAKFGAFAAASTGLSAALTWAAARSGLRLLPCASGPYGLIFSCFVQYFFLVPPASKMAVFGWRLSDKVFLYLVGLQLLLSGGTSSLLAGGAGLLAGLAYRGNVGGIRRLRLPAFVTRFLASTLGPLLGSSDSPAPPPAPHSHAHTHHHAPTSGAQGPGGQRGHTAGPAAAAGGGGGFGASGATAAAGGGAAGGGAGLPAAAREAVEQLVGMGFGEAASERALQLANNDVQTAIGLLLNM